MKSGKSLKDYKQSFTMKLHQADIVLFLDHESKVEILKSRYGYKKEDLDVEETINILTTILTRKILGSNLDMFREGLKVELTKVINQTIKGGVAPCEPHSTNEQLEWVSSV